MNHDEPESEGGEGIEDELDDPKYEAIFAATFKNLPTIQLIEKQWEEMGLQPNDPSRLDLELHAVFDRRLEIVAGAMIHAYRKQNEAFAEVYGGYHELAQNLLATQQHSTALREDLEKFVTAGAALVDSQRNLSTTLKETTTLLQTTILLCKERRAAYIVAQILIPMLAMAFGAVLTLVLLHCVWKTLAL